MGVGCVTLPPLLCDVVHSNFQPHPPGLASFFFQWDDSFRCIFAKLLTKPAVQDDHTTHYPSDLIQSQTLPLPPPHLNPPQSVYISLQAKERQRSQRHQTDRRLLIDHMELGRHSKMSLPLPRLVKGGRIGTSAHQLLRSASSHLR